MSKGPIDECSRSEEELKSGFPFPECDRCKQYTYDDGLSSCDKLSNQTER